MFLTKNQGQHFGIQDQGQGQVFVIEDIKCQGRFARTTRLSACHLSAAKHNREDADYTTQWIYNSKPIRLLQFDKEKESERQMVTANLR